MKKTSVVSGVLGAKRFVVMLALCLLFENIQARERNYDAINGTHSLAIYPRYRSTST